MARKDNEKQFNPAFVHYCNKVQYAQQITDIKPDGYMQTQLKDPFAAEIAKEINTPTPPAPKV